MRPSYQRHRRQFFWQIIFPLVLVILVFLAVGIAAALGSNGQASLWSDAAQIWLLLPLLLLMLIPLALMVVLVVGMVYLLQAMPGWIAQLQDWVTHLAKWTRTASDKAAAPFITAAGFKAALQHALSRKKKE